MKGMSVLIRGMEMPAHCAACPIERLYDYGDEIAFYCLLNDGDTKQVRSKCRRPDCPLVSVPAHGRLIDADALTVKLQRHREYHSDGSMSGAAISNGIGQCLDIINGKECPTIIPAEEGVG